MMKRVLIVIFSLVFSISAFSQPKDIIGLSSLYLGEIVIPENTSPLAFSQELIRRGWEGGKYTGENHYRFAKRTDEENSYVLDFWYTDLRSIDRYQVEWQITPFIYGYPTQVERHETWVINCNQIFQKLIEIYTHKPYHWELFAAEGRFVLMTLSGIPIILTKEENSISIVSTFCSKEAMLKEQIEFDSQIIASIIEQAKVLFDNKEFELAKEEFEKIEVIESIFKTACREIGVSMAKSEAADKYISMTMKSMAELPELFFSKSDNLLAWSEYINLISYYDYDELGPLSQDVLAKLRARCDEIEKLI